MNTNPGRRAYGPHGYRTPATKARDIAASILAHRAQGRERSIEKDYGVTDAVLRGLVEQALAAMARRQAA